MSSSLIAIRASADANTAEQKRLAERKRSLIVLVNQFLVEQGYVEAAERLQHEASAVLTKFDVADNIDLPLIVTEYEAYYEMRFDKKPKLLRKLEAEEVGRTAKLPKPDSSKKAKATTGQSDKSDKLPSIGGVAAAGPETEPSFGVSGTNITASGNAQKKAAAEPAVDKFEDRILKPPPQFGGDPEMKQLAAIIGREIYQESPNVRFEDIIELDEAKRLLVEAVQLPLRFPSLFTGILRPWRGILLHGPPGTGKTLLAKAVATECHTTFFNISASTLVSKWRGDSEKLVRALFDMARHYAPSTIFLDEIDSILTSRDGEGGEHEASRRMKTELLIQMDGISAKGSGCEQQVFVMAASNLPWDLDVALLRRLEKRVLVTLPGQHAREKMLSKHLQERSAADLDFAAVAERTAGYSGADIELVCREAAMMPVRRLLKKVDHLQMDSTMPDPPVKGNASKRPVAKAMKPAQEIEQLLKEDPVTMNDMNLALASTKSSSDGKISRYEQWQQEFGSV